MASFIIGYVLSHITLNIKILLGYLTGRIDRCVKTVQGCSLKHKFITKIHNHTLF